MIYIYIYDIYIYIYIHICTGNISLLKVNTKINNYCLKIKPSLRATRNCKSARVSSLS